VEFLYIDPLKQGLKLFIECDPKVKKKWFLYIDPLKQGLKPSAPQPCRCAIRVFIHRSIKTRIETFRFRYSSSIFFRFLYIDPLKQGLKLFVSDTLLLSSSGFYT